MASYLRSAPLTSAGAPSSSYPTTSFLPSLLIIAALLAFVLVASVSIHMLLRSLSRSPPPLLPRTHRDDEHAADRGVDAAEEGKEEGDEKQRRLIESLPQFTMASALVALPKSSPDCAVCLSPFTLDAELRLLPACRHAFHAYCVDAWLRTTLTCPLCRAIVSTPHRSISVILAAEQPPSPDPRSRDLSRSFCVEMGSVSNHGSSTAGSCHSRTYSLGSFDYHTGEEIEAVVSRMARAASMATTTVKEEKPAAEETPQSPGEVVAEAARPSRGWLQEYVDRLASSASSFTTFSGRWSSRCSQRHRQEEPWLWDTEAVTMSAPGSDEEETAFMALCRWLSAV